MVNFTERLIKDLNRDDLKVAVSGVVVDKGERSFMIDDGTGQVGVFFEGNIENGRYVRVFGRLVNLDSKEIEAEFVQDLNKIDKKLHRRVLELDQG